MNTKMQNELRNFLRQHADPIKAKEQQRYMKSTMPYAGLTAGDLRKGVREIFKAMPLSDKASWLSTVEVIWDQAELREERYAAIELLAFNKYQKTWLGPDCLQLLRHMIITGAWWDYVDNLASNHVGVLLARYPKEIKPELEKWIPDPDLWVRRTSILAQLKFKDTTDTDFLHRAIQGSINDNDFFARKAIGWALRQYARSDADWVRSYVDKYQDQLSNLSKREALKHL